MVYVFLTLHVTDKAVFDAYREVAGKPMTLHSCKVVSVGRENVMLDGAAPVPTVAVLLSFDSKEQAQAWMDDPEIADIHQLRRDCGDLSIMLVA